MSYSAVVAGDFRQLVVWQKAADLCVDVFTLANRLRSVGEYELMAQLKDASLSVPANIAEGNGRMYPGDYARFASIARGSVREVQSHLSMVERLRFESQARLNPLQLSCEEISKMLFALHHRLRSQ